MTQRSGVKSLEFDTQGLRPVGEVTAGSLSVAIIEPRISNFEHRKGSGYT
jgi:hypothetical protein